MTYTQTDLPVGRRVSTPGGRGSVDSVQLAAPDYVDVEAVYVMLDGKRGTTMEGHDDLDYLHTAFPVADVTLAP